MVTERTESGNTVKGQRPKIKTWKTSRNVVAICLHSSVEQVTVERLSKCEAIHYVTVSYLKVSTFYLLLPSTFYVNCESVCHSGR